MRIVVKIGTNLITAKDGSLDPSVVSRMCKDISSVKKTGNQVVVVTSGAIGAGMGKMRVSARPSSLREKQALAAIGQPILMNAYQDAFNKLGQTSAQVLLTRHDLDDRHRYLNARNTILSLLEMGVIPIINENDTIAVEEINFGDNDTLSALVSAKISADNLLILTDVDGLFKGSPGKGEIIPVVEKITPEIESYASEISGSGRGVGGMKTKIAAAKIATSAGVNVYLANGSKPGIIGEIAGGKNTGTVFLARGVLGARKCWIAFGAKCRGKITVDNGAAKALVEKGKSLLPSGIVTVEGKFKIGDTVSVFDLERNEIARGLSYYSSEEVDKIKGKKSAEIKEILKNSGFDEVLHRDNLVIL